MITTICNGKEYVDADAGEYADYKFALEVAGATVHAYEQFGSYQGDWLAKVTYDGETFWIQDCYGSCSGCDAFEGDLHSEYHENKNVGYEKESITAFGKNYLAKENRLTYEQALEKVSKYITWDCDAQKMIDFVKANA